MNGLPFIWLSSREVIEIYKSFNKFAMKERFTDQVDIYIYCTFLNLFMDEFLK